MHLPRDWKLYKCESVIRDGYLVEIGKPGSGHAAVHGIKLDPFSDVELKVDIRFAGSRSTNLDF